jgi:hypothetical protein
MVDSDGLKTINWVLQYVGVDLVVVVEAKK